MSVAPSEGGTGAPLGDVTPETDATPALDGVAPDSRTVASRKREPCSLLAGVPCVLVIAETMQGKTTGPACELLGLARRLADQAGGMVAAALLRNGGGVVAEELIARGADRVYVAEHVLLGEYHAAAWVPAIATVRSGCYDALAPDSGRSGSVMPVQPEIDATAIRTRIVGRKRDAAEGVRLEDAKV